MKNVALEQGRLAVEKSPDDLRLQDNVRYYQTGDNDNSEAA
jgi:hypothetical protein